MKNIIVGCILQITSRWRGTGLSLVGHWFDTGFGTVLRCGVPLDSVALVRTCCRLFRDANRVVEPGDGVVGRGVPIPAERWVVGNVPAITMWRTLLYSGFHMPQAVTYHEPTVMWLFMVGHSLGRVETCFGPSTYC